MRALFAVAVVWVILFAVPFAIYGTSSVLFGSTPPAGPAWRFLASVAITKAGTAIAFVALYALARSSWGGRWLVYAAVWFVMFAISELGDAVKPGYSIGEALLGILSEAIYTPLSALTADRFLR